MRRIDDSRMFLIAIALGATACNYSLHSNLGGSSSSSDSTPASSPTSGSGASSSGSDPAPVASSGEASKPPPPKPEAEPDPGFEKLTPPAMPAGPAPKITIVSPSSDQELIGVKTRAPDDKFSSLECLQDARTFSIKVAAQNWPVAPGGPGVLVVVDGVYATVTHDLTKPIMMAELEPYERVDNDATYAELGPMYECGHHWIAAMPTAANGMMLPVAPTVSWFFNRSKNYHTDDESADDRNVRLSFNLPVVNWPLIGPAYLGGDWRNSFGDERRAAHRNGRVARTPDRVVFDWTLARGTSQDPCKLTISRQDINGFRFERAQIPTHGTVVLPPTYLTGPLIVNAEKCGGMSEYVSTIWTKQPSGRSSYKWPVPGGAEAEDFWSSDEGQAAFARSSAAGSSGGGGGGGGGGGKCKSQCTVSAGQCRTSCKGAKCANDCGKAEKSCKSSC